MVAVMQSRRKLIAEPGLGSARPSLDGLRVKPEFIRIRRIVECYSTTENFASDEETALDVLWMSDNQWFRETTFFGDPLRFNEHPARIDRTCLRPDSDQCILMLSVPPWLEVVHIVEHFPLTDDRPYRSACPVVFLVSELNTAMSHQDVGLARLERLRLQPFEGEDIVFQGMVHHRDIFHCRTFGVAVAAKPLWRDEISFSNRDVRTPPEIFGEECGVEDLVS